MTMFNDREVAFEARFAQEAEVLFHEIGRRNRLLGEWAAGHLGLTGQAMSDYVAGIVHAEVLSATDESVLIKVRDDLTAAGLVLASGQVAEKMHQFHEEARTQLKPVTPPA